MYAHVYIMNEHRNPLHQKEKRLAGQKKASLEPASNKSPQVEMKRFKPRFEKSRRSSEAHSIAIFKEKLKDFGLHHGNGKDELEKHNFEVALQGLPVVSHLHTIVYAVTCVLVLVATSFAANNDMSEVPSLIDLKITQMWNFELC